MPVDLNSPNLDNNSLIQLLKQKVLELTLEVDKLKEANKVPDPIWDKLTALAQTVVKNKKEVDRRLQILMDNCIENEQAIKTTQQDTLWKFLPWAKSYKKKLNDKKN